MQTVQQNSGSSTSAVAYVNKLVAASKPFIRINSSNKLDWCRVMEKPTDPRIGPWHYCPDYHVLDEKVWTQLGEVLYFVTDSHKRVRLVGQSAKKLKDRWRTSPMFDVNTHAPLGKKSLFHSSAWPAIEAGFDKGDSSQFTLSAIFRPELQNQCLLLGGPFLALLEKPETDLRRLAYHVEQWVCSLSNEGLDLWNKQGVKRK
jgi:hypothetical protein